MAGLYIHIPYCHAKCAYCDFYSTPRRDDAEALVAAIVEEWRLRRNELRGEDVNTVYIGGGTPSCLPDPLLSHLVSSIKTDCSEKIEEFTLEVNPEDVTAERAFAWADIGITRVSMGVQSLDDDQLRTVGRRHTAAEAIKAVESLRKSPVGANLSLDLIYGLPGQSLVSWQQTLDGLLQLRPQHLSCYLLSYEQGTRLWAMRQAGKVKEASDYLANEMYQYLCEKTSETGYEHYEISNWALTGFRAIHNSSYWQMKPYLGLGPAAHSFDGLKTRRANPPDIRQYLRQIQEGHTACEEEVETEEELLDDRILTGLRTSTGVPADIVLPRARRLIADGYLSPSEDGRQLRIPERHWLLADWIIRQLLVG